MTTKVVAVEPDAHVEEITRKPLERCIVAVPVVDANGLVERPGVKSSSCAVQTGGQISTARGRSSCFPFRMSGALTSAVEEHTVALGPENTDGVHEIEEHWGVITPQVHSASWAE